MPILGFYSQNVKLVENGKKFCTIRPRRKDGKDPKVGEYLYLYAGMRTKDMRQIGTGLCTHAIPIEIYDCGTKLGGKWLQVHQEIKLWKDDGFDNEDAYRNFFLNRTNRDALKFDEEGGYGKYFVGLLIKWEPVKTKNGRIIK